MNTLKMTILKARKAFQKMMQENGFEKNKIEYFKSMVDKAVGNGSVSSNVANLYMANGGEAILNDASLDTFARNVRNWLNSRSLPSCVKNLERKKYLDLLLFLGIHKRHTKKKLAGFNNDIGMLGLEKLYILDYFDFCVAVSILLEDKKGINAYTTFRKLYNDVELENVSNSGGVDLNGQFTQDIARDFEKIETIGSISDTKDGAYNVMSAYKFVSKYAHEFGRCHVSRYFAYASLLCGASVDSITRIITQKERKNTIGLYERRDGEIYEYQLNDIIQFALTRRDVQVGLYLLSEQMFSNCVRYLHSIDYQEYREYVLDGKGNTDNARYVEDEELDKELDLIHTKFAKIGSGEIFEIPNADFGRVINNKENISREMMLATILVTLSSSVIKMYEGEFAMDYTKAGAIMEKKINRMLESCRMLELNTELSKYDFLLLYALHNIDYREVVAYKGAKKYPFREFVFYQFLNEDLYKAAFSDDIKNDDEVNSDNDEDSDITE